MAEVGDRLIHTQPAPRAQDPGGLAAGCLAAHTWEAGEDDADGAGSVFGLVKPARAALGRASFSSRPLSGR